MKARDVIRTYIHTPPIITLFILEYLAHFLYFSPEQMHHLEALGNKYKDLYEFIGSPRSSYKVSPDWRPP